MNAENRDQRIENRQTKERPILFSGRMVNAILAGKKTQTRRAVKGLVNTVVGTEYCFHETNDGMWEVGFDYGNGLGDFLRYINCPFGRPGDRLWVRETWQGYLVDNPERAKDLGWKFDNWVDGKALVYRASSDLWHKQDKWKPSIFSQIYVHSLHFNAVFLHCK